MTKIINGKYKGKLIIVPKGKLVRPTSAMKKETIFNILESRFLKSGEKGIFKNKIILDAFAGSGGLGIEALSRGASFCHFIEKNKTVIKYLNKNCMNILNKNEYKIYNDNYYDFSFLKIKKNIDIVFFDPPYDFLINRIMFEKILNNNNYTPTFIIETNKKTVIPKIKNLTYIDERIIGKTKISLITSNY